MTDLDTIFQQLHQDGVIERLEDVQEEQDHFTAAHVARHLPASDAIDTPYDAHEYIQDLEASGYVEQVDTDVQRSVRYRFADGYDDLLGQ